MIRKDSYPLIHNVNKERKKEAKKERKHYYYCDIYNQIKKDIKFVLTLGSTLRYP
jgi:hypothetical protein